jgi:transcriptional regulator with XRE-family HTH domain
LVIDLDEVKRKFGSTVKAIRKSKKITLLQLSVACGIDDSTIAKIEKGTWDNQLSTIFILAFGLKVEPKELLDFGKYLDAENKSPNPTE